MALFVPSSSLTRQIGKDGLVLNLATEDWFNLQSNTQAVLGLPFNFGEFQTRYGDASSGVQMQEAFDAMNVLQRVASRYGTPSTLRKRVTDDPGLLATEVRPSDDAYLSTVWTLQRTHQDAAGLARSLANIPSAAKGRPDAEVVAGIKSMFLDTDQVLDKVRRTESELAAMISEMQSIASALADAQEQMRQYTSNSSKTMVFLNTEIGELESKIEQLEKQRDAAWRKWLGLTISAVAVPAGIAILGIAIMVVLAVPTGGASFAVGTAITGAAAGAALGVLGTAAGVARSGYEALVDEVANKEDLLRKRVAYRHDLGALDSQMNFTLPASTGVIAQFQAMKNAWGSLGSEIRGKVADLTVDNLRSGPWLDPVQMQEASGNWNRVDQAITRFITNAFIDASVAQFGAPMPADDPKWQDEFAAIVAA